MQHSASSSLVRIAGVLVAALLPFESASAWSYEEHRRLAAESFRVACDEARPYTGDVKALCETDRIIECYGHMVALAADRADAPEEFVGAELEGQLLLRAKQGVNCRSLAPGTDAVADDYANAGMLHQGGIRGFWTYARLLTQNASHFQPDAISKWKRHLHKAKSIDTDDLQLLLATHAFSSHFLQDAFSAGHNGINRDKIRQDYDHGYHDDVNATGLFLRNRAGDAWHSYGDRHLDDSSRYLLTDYCRDGAADLDDDLAALSGVRPYPLAPSARTKLCELEGPAALSIADRDDSLFSLCFYWDNCPKPELIVASNGSADEFMDACPPQHGQALLECPSTGRYVRDAMTLQIGLLLSLFEKDRPSDRSLDARIHEIRRKIPHEYRALAGRSGGEVFLNKESFLLDYSDWKPLKDRENYEQAAFRNWTFSLYQSQSDYPTLRETTLSWALMVKGSDGLGDAIPEWLRNRSRMELRFDLASDDGALLDGAEMNVGVELYRPFRRVFGIALNGAIGVDDAWGGHPDRNWFHGGGVEVNFHFGRNVVFLAYQALEHSNRRFEPDHSKRFFVGWRVATLSLSH